MHATVIKSELFLQRSLKRIPLYGKECISLILNLHLRIHFESVNYRNLAEKICS